MIKNLVIGAGFSAAFAKIILGKKAKIIGCIDEVQFKNLDLIRRKSLECNKILSTSAFSYGTLEFNLKNGKLHDRLSSGGNSNIWGGTIDTKKISKKFINLLNKNKIFLQKFSYEKTGTTSNNHNLSQLQTKNNKIFKVKDLPIRIENNYVLKILKDKKKISVETINNKIKKKNIESKKIILCVGTIQLLDILFRSGFIKNNDIIEFSEFKSEFKWRFLNAKFKKNTLIERYQFARAIGHYFGIQYFSKIFKLFKFIPLRIDQIYYPKKINYKLILKNGIITEVKSNKPNKFFFGESVHYCNMRINKLNINNFLKRIDKNFIGIGMPFINQNLPGPISNEIVLDMMKKLEYFD